MHAAAVLVLSVAITTAASQSSICEHTYGPGSLQCGSASTAMCYNPRKGQSCCTDNGYCERGQYCAPVTGYCCLSTESLQECASSAGFQVPLKDKPLMPAIRPRATPPQNTPKMPYQKQTSAVARRENTLLWTGLGISIVGVIVATV